METYEFNTIVQLLQTQIQQNQRIIDLMEEEEINQEEELKEEKDKEDVENYKRE